MEGNSKPAIYEYLDKNLLKVRLEFEEGFRKSDYQYAFYLRKGEERIATVWYQSEPETTFEIKNTGIYHVVSFVKSLSSGETIPYLSGKYFCTGQNTGGVS